MHFLITGHTGFKGSWLSLLLHHKGHTVSGISLDPIQDSLFEQARIFNIFENDVRLDIRNSKKLSEAIEKINPEVIIHLAAQPLVRVSYREPIATYEVNVLGTLNVLESTKNLQNLLATLVITTDKVYKNVGHLRGYVESDELGGDDPYSASKAAADIATQSWVKSFAKNPVAIARAGTVIGGGDWSEDRLIPDIFYAFSKGKLPKLRYPNSIRPWQHVLDCVNGYVMLVEKMISTNVGGEWNFGPNFDEKYSVSDVTETFAELWGLSKNVKNWNLDNSDSYKEASYLLLDSNKARSELLWKDHFDFKSALESTVNWYKAFLNGETVAITNQQIEDYLAFFKS